jgi:hypothetical protein
MPKPNIYYDYRCKELRMLYVLFGLQCRQECKNKKVDMPYGS